MSSKWAHRDPCWVSFLWLSYELPVSKLWALILHWVPNLTIPFSSIFFWNPLEDDLLKHGTGCSENIPSGLCISCHSEIWWPPLSSVGNGYPCVGLTNTNTSCKPKGCLNRRINMNTRDLVQRFLVKHWFYSLRHKYIEQFVFFSQKPILSNEQWNG